MKKLKRSLALVLAVVLLMPLLAGCGRRELDGVKAVEAYLKAQTKGEFGDYAELTGTDEQELKDAYEESLDDVMSIFEEVELFKVDFGDSVKEEVKKILGSVKYEVISAEKDGDDDYVVDVDVYPSDVFGLAFGKLIEASRTAGGDTEMVGDLMIQAFSDAVAEQSYGEAVRCQIHINYDEASKQYSINETDAQDLAENFFDLEGALENLFAPSGTVYDNPYFNWTVTEWNGASEEEKAQCCLAILQTLQGLSDEDIAGLDLNDPNVQTAIEQMKDAVDLTYSGGTQISIGDYVEMVKGQM
ncbi:MAG: hypothetical protein HFH10_05075 [Dorea sp.]|nr:hypothetical protein [Dorea sp.]